MTRLYLMRHAEVEPRYQGVFGGRIDMDLSDQGRSQAEWLAAFVNKQALEALYASPMKRARQTVQPLAQSSRLVPVILEDLREVDFGDWTGLTGEEVHRQFHARAGQWLDYLDRGAIPNAECSQAWRRRVQSCLNQILENHSGRSIGVVCHGGVIRMCLSLLLDLPLGRTATFAIEYASVTKVDLRPDKVTLQLLNLAPWRDRL